MYVIKIIEFGQNWAWESNDNLCQLKRIRARIFPGL